MFFLQSPKIQSHLLQARSIIIKQKEVFVFVIPVCKNEFICISLSTKLLVPLPFHR